MELQQDLTIGEWLEGRSIFVTGASGLLGKVLLEKLLRECPTINKIYILLRGKKGKGVEERMRLLKQSTAFIQLREKCPELLDKIIPLEGDVSELGLGLSASDRGLVIKEATAVFHVAASVRFDDPLQQALFINTRSTREVVELAKEIPRLDVFVYVSTAYTNCDNKVIEEKIYPAKVSWRKVLKAAETMSEQVLNTFAEKIIGEYPNTYIFTKNLAEQVVWDSRDKLPIVIYRPSVVVNSAREPEPGWMDSLNSPTALIGAVGKGVLRVHGGPLDNKTEYVAVDTTVTGIIVSAWYHGCYLPRHPELNKDPMPVYNSTTIGLPTQVLSDFGLNVVKKYPMSNHLWRVYFVCVPNQALYLFFTVLVHFLPALIYDAIFKAAGMKIRLTRIYRTIFVTCQSLRAFMFNEWVIKRERFDSLADKLLVPDRGRYNFEVFNEDLTVDDYLMNAAMVGRRYLFNEPANITPQIWKHTKRMYWIDMIGRILLAGLFLWILPLQKMYDYAFDTSLSINKFLFEI